MDVPKGKPRLKGDDPVPAFDPGDGLARKLYPAGEGAPPAVPVFPPAEAPEDERLKLRGFIVDGLCAAESGCTDLCII